MDLEYSNSLPASICQWVWAELKELSMIRYMMKKQKFSLSKDSKVLSFLILFTLLASGCSSQSSGEDSDEFKMNQYYDCIQRYMNKGIYSSTEIENICRVLLP